MGDTHFTNPFISLVTFVSLLQDKHSEMTADTDSCDQMW